MGGLPYTLRHDKDHDLTRARSERCGHTIDPFLDGRAPDVGAVIAECGTLPPLELVQRSGPAQGYGGTHTVAEAGAGGSHPTTAASEIFTECF